MQLKEFSLLSPVVESGTVLKALETAISSEAIEQAIGETHSHEERKRALPSHLVVCLIIAMSLWSCASMRTVLKNLIDGLSEAWVKVGQYWRVPCKSSITEARQRVRVLMLLRSLTQGMLLMWDRGLHSYAMVKATLATRCDYLGRVPKNVKFQVEKVLEDGSYLSWIAPDGKSKKKGATRIMVRVIEYTIDTDGEPQIYRLITSLTDIVVFPALLLAAEYHQRWEVEITIDELKVHLNGRKTGGGASPAPLPFVPKIPARLFKRFMAGCLDIALKRSLMFQVAMHAQISPLRLGNTCTLNVVRRAVPKFQHIEPEALPFFGLGVSLGNFG